MPLKSTASARRFPTPAEVLESARRFPDGGGYDASGSGTGTPNEITRNGVCLLSSSETGFYCCGFTFAVAIAALAGRELPHGEPIAPVFYRLQKEWYGAVDEPDIRERQLVRALENPGWGHAVEHDDAMPGDFVQFWRGGRGHSAIFLGWMETREGIRYRGAQATTNGVGDVEERFIDRGGTVDPKRMYFARFHQETEVVPRAYPIRPMPSQHEKVLSVLCVRNEAGQLPSFLQHVRDHVDGFVAVDDGSTDDTVEILSREPKLRALVCREHRPSTDTDWDEAANRRTALLRAKEVGATWVLTIDPDMRLESRFLHALHEIRARADRDQRWLVTLWLRELWDHPCLYRVDGIWGLKLRGILFRLPESMTFGNYRALHGPWFPAELADRRLMQIESRHVYHLGSVRPEWRRRRRDRYRALDPEETMTTVGYDYLADDTGLEVAPTDGHDHEYDTTTLPPALSSLLVHAANEHALTTPGSVVSTVAEYQWRVVERFYAALVALDLGAIDDITRHDLNGRFEDDNRTVDLCGRNVVVARLIEALRTRIGSAYPTRTTEDGLPAVRYMDRDGRCCLLAQFSLQHCVIEQIVVRVAAIP